MKQDRNGQHHQGESVEKDKKPNASSAQSALDSYYDDILGSIGEDPLAQLEARAKQERDPKPQKSSLVTDKDFTSFKAKRELNKREATTSIAGPKLAPNKPAVKNKTLARAKPLAQNKPKEIVSPVVIPAAFPKLAPKLAEPEEPKPVLKTKVKTKTDPVTTEPGGLATPTPNASPVKPAVKISKPHLEELEITARVSPSSRVPSPEPSVPREEPVQTEVVSNEAESEAIPPQEWLENVRPVWAQDRFECLIFSVAGLKLAVPLISLGAIYRIEKEFTPLVGRANWFMGLYRTTDRNVQVVDTAMWVMPDRYREGVREGYEYVIRLGGNNWGVACDAVHEAIQLEPTQVKWRSERSKRPWLSGTVIDHMCALLDADTLSYLLQKDQKAH